MPERIQPYKIDEKGYYSEFQTHDGKFHISRPIDIINGELIVMSPEVLARKVKPVATEQPHREYINFRFRK